MKKGQFKKGFKPLNAQIEGKEKYVADCSSCGAWDENDGCMNPNSLPYDLIIEENRNYCVYWYLSIRKRED